MDKSVMKILAAVIAIGLAALGMKINYPDLQKDICAINVPMVSVSPSPSPGKP